MYGIIPAMQMLPSISAANTIPANTPMVQNGATFRAKCTICRVTGLTSSTCVMVQRPYRFPTGQASTRVPATIYVRNLQWCNHPQTRLGITHLHHCPTAAHPGHSMWSLSTSVVTIATQRSPEYVH